MPEALPPKWEPDYQQMDVLPVPDTAFVPFWLRLRVPHWVSALAWAPWGVAFRTKLLALTLLIEIT